MRYSLMAFVLGLAMLAGSALASHKPHTCDGTPMCYNSYIDCLNQGFSQSFCYGIYWACARACAPP